MAGIAGIYYSNGGASLPDAKRMVMALAHRGPDGTSTWSSEDVALGHCALHSTPESVFEDQPQASSNGAHVLTADARLDNRDELTRALAGHGRLSGPIPDSHIILEAYARWGANCPAHLIGDFAFAIWDEREHRLFCARDHLGLRPFYYYRSDTCFAFASEIKALLALDCVPHRPDEMRIADYLMQATSDTEATFYEGIRRLPPGSSMVVTAEGVRLQQYWTAERRPELCGETEEGNADAYRRHFSEAVSCRLRSSSKVGAYLSGGMDSSSIVCMAREQLRARQALPLDTFSLVFDDVPESDERPYMEAVTAQGGLRPHFIRGDGISPLDDLDEILQHVDEPFITPNLFLNWHLFRSAHSCGVRVLLDGFLGDNVVSHGSRLITERAAAGRWISVLRDIYRIARRYPAPYRAAWDVVHRFAIEPLVLEPSRRAWYARKQATPPLHPSEHFISRDLLRNTRWLERADALDVVMPRTPRTAREEHDAEFTSGILPSALETVNKAATAFGMEVRFPFSDRRLVEFCLALPPEQKYDLGLTRLIVRRALADSLPPKIRKRFGKASLRPVFERSLLFLSKEELSGVIYEKLPAAAAFIDVKSVQSAYARIETGRARENTLQAIWNTVVLSRWLEREHDSGHSPRGDSRSTPYTQKVLRPAGA